MNGKQAGSSKSTPVRGTCCAGSGLLRLSRWFRSVANGWRRPHLAQLHAGSLHRSSAPLCCAGVHAVEQAVPAQAQPQGSSGSKARKGGGQSGKKGGGGSGGGGSEKRVTPKSEDFSRWVPRCTPQDGDRPPESLCVNWSGHFSGRCEQTGVLLCGYAVEIKTEVPYPSHTIQVSSWYD